MSVLSNFFGKKTDVLKERVDLCTSSPQIRTIGGHGIVGGQTPLGLGMAYALKYKGLKGSVFFMGDGATNQGPFYESLNLASLWNLPVVYVIENNGYSMGTAEARHSAGEPLAVRRGDPFDVDWSFAMVMIFMKCGKLWEMPFGRHMKLPNLGSLKSLPTGIEGTLLRTLIKLTEAKRRSRSIRKVKTRSISLSPNLLMKVFSAKKAQRVLMLRQKKKLMLLLNLQMPALPPNPLSSWMMFIGKRIIHRRELLVERCSLKVCNLSYYF